MEERDADRNYWQAYCNNLRDPFAVAVWSIKLFNPIFLLILILRV